MKNSSTPLLDWVSQTLSPLKCLSPWSATFVLSNGQPNSSGVNAARYKIFCKMYAPHTGDKPLEKIKSAKSCCS